MALDTPTSRGICLSMSLQRWLMLLVSPSEPKVRITPSSALNVNLERLCLDAGLDLLRAGHLGVVHEVLTALRARRQSAREHVLQALDDGGLAAAVVPHDHGERRVELDDLRRRQREHAREFCTGRRTYLVAIRAEAANAADRQLLDAGHPARVLTRSSTRVDGQSVASWKRRPSAAAADI
eukprot:scaffold1610_cov257-Pinguiococcus_pyrenoidosus.AAC.12